MALHRMERDKLHLGMHAEKLFLAGVAEKGARMWKRLALAGKIIATVILLAILVGMVAVAFNLQLW